MTEPLYRDDAYLKSCPAQVAQVTENTVTLSQTVFFPNGGGQPGDTGTLHFGEDSFPVTDTTFDRERNQLLHHVDKAPPANAQIIATLDWQRRYLTMRTHTALHLLYAAVQVPVTGGRMDPGRGRLDFDMPDPPARDEIEAKLAEFVAADLAVTTKWVDWEYLDANPQLVKTMAVQPPRTQHKVSLVEIAGVDLQACGGTHVKQTSEIGVIKIAKVEKKGKLNRRIVIEVTDG